MDIKLYDQSQETDWDLFIEKNKRNGTFLHSRKFFDHNPQNVADDSSLLFYKKGKIRAVLPACIYEFDGKRVFHSHLRSTYGGFVVDETIGVEEAVEMVDQTIAFAKNERVTEVIIRNPFRIFHRLPSDETDYAMWYRGFNIKYRELECAVKLDEFAISRYENGAKYNIKKACKVVSVMACEEYADFWKMLTENLALKHNSKPTHTIEQFTLLQTLVGKEKIKMFGGYIDGRLVCGVVLFLTANVIHAQYIASDSNFQDVRPLNAVIDYIIAWGKTEKYEYFNLGMANDAQGKEINYGLYHFKEGFGARGVLRETMHIFL